MKILVCHALYGCDTGCCGHVVVVEDEAGGRTQKGRFEFAHPDGMTEAAIKEFVRDMVTDALGEEHVKDIDFERCEVLDD